MANELDRVREEGGLDLAVVEQEAQSFLGVAKVAAPRGGALRRSDSSAVEVTANRLVTLLRRWRSQAVAASEPDDR